MARAPLPKGLKTQGAAMWRGVTKSYELRVDELRILRDACREIDLIERLEEELADGPLQVSGSMGQIVSSPLVSELRQHRMTLKTLLGALKLPDEAGSGVKSDVSTPARKAAAARWA